MISAIDFSWGFSQRTVTDPEIELEQGAGKMGSRRRRGGKEA